MNVEKIQMWKANNRKGATILKTDYDLIAKYILLILTRDGEVELKQLMDKVQNELSSHFSKDLLWYFIQVKQDLVERGLVKVTLLRNRIQVIRLHKKKDPFSHFRSVIIS